MKYFPIIAVFSIMLLLCGCSLFDPQVVVSEPFLQKQPDKLVNLTCGDYTVTTGKRFNGKIAKLAFQGKDLFVKAGATQLGTLYEAPFPKDKNAKFSITVDGVTPEFIDGDISGKEIMIRRSSDYGDLKIFSNYTLNGEGLTWSVRYRIVSEKHKARYFYLFTVPWSTDFTEFVYWKNKEQKSGRFTDSKKWLLCDDIDHMVLYSPKLKVGTVTEVVGKLPTEIRRHTLWDMPYYHKYFLFHAKPEWKAGFESEVYTLKLRAFAADEKNYIQKSNIKQ